MNPYVYFFVMVGLAVFFVVVLVGGVMRMGRKTAGHQLSFD